MLDFADMIVLNKFEKRGAEDALRDVRKQWRRNHPDAVETAGRGDPGVSHHRQPLQRSGRESPVPGAVRGARSRESATPDAGRSATARRSRSRPRNSARAIRWFRPRASRYLAEIAAQGRGARANGRRARRGRAARARPVPVAAVARRPALCRRRWPPAPEAGRRRRRSTRCARPTTARSTEIGSRGAGRAAKPGRSARAGHHARPSIPTPCAAARCAAPTTPNR